MVGVSITRVRMARQRRRSEQETRWDVGGSGRVQEPDLARRWTRVLAGKVWSNRTCTLHQDRCSPFRVGRRFGFRSFVSVEMVRHDAVQRRQSVRLVLRWPSWMNGCILLTVTRAMKKLGYFQFLHLVTLSMTSYFKYFTNRNLV